MTRTKKTKKTPITYVLMVTDGSGSMMNVAQDVRGGFNSYLQTLKESGGNYRVTVLQFDTEFQWLCVNNELKDVPQLDSQNYRPRGYTALLDATGMMITEFERRVPELEKGDKVVLVIQTDGHENASKEYTFDKVKALLDARVVENGPWAVIYIGAGPDTWNQASRMGVQQGMYVNTSGSGASTRRAYGAVAQSVAGYSSGEMDNDAMVRSVKKATEGS